MRKRLCLSVGVKRVTCWILILSELMLLEEFKNSLSDRLVTYLDEQKVATLAQAAVLADEFVLTCKQTFGTPRNDSRIVSSLCSDST